MLRFIIVFTFSLMIISPYASAKSLNFSSYQVKEIYRGQNYPAQQGDEYRSSTLEQVLKNKKVNFAGHYIIYMDSCGTGGCILYAIADAKTGENIASLPTVYMGDVEDQYTPTIDYKVNSKLIHVSGVNAEMTNQYQDDYFILENNHLKKITGVVKVIQKK